MTQPGWSVDAQEKLVAVAQGTIARRSDANAGTTNAGTAS
jgi:hypothetical protein